MVPVGHVDCCDKARLYCIASSAATADAKCWRNMLSLLLLRIVQAAYLTHAAALDCMRRLRLRLARSVALPEKTPMHVGIVVGGDEPTHLQQLAALIGWVRAAGVRCVTLCDVHGELLRTRTDLRAALAEVGLGSATVLGAGESPPPDAIARGDELAVRVVALRTGREDITVAARRLCEQVRAGRLPASAIDEAAVESELQANAGFPEPVRVHQCMACQLTTCTYVCVRACARACATG